MKKKIEPAAAAEKAAPKPAAPITSSGLKIELDPPRVTPPNRGPMTGMGQMPDQDFVSQCANPEELATFRAAIEQRRARDAASWIFFRCDNPRCGLVMKDKPGAPEGDPCPKSNRMRRVDGDHLQRMGQAEVDQHLYAEAVREKAALERDRRAAFNGRNLERAKAGLPPMTFTDFTTQAKREFEELKARGRALGQVASIYRRQS